MTAAIFGNDNSDKSRHSSDLKIRLQTASKTIKVEGEQFDLEAKILAGNVLLKNQTTVIFALLDSDLVLPVHVADRVVIGRIDADGSDKVDIDLMPYEGRKLGISRRHAALYRSRHTVSLVDLNSSNGTYLNGIRLVPHQPRLLREGDEVRMGNMRFRITFDR
jgi:hypothetical protein